MTIRLTSGRVTDPKNPDKKPLGNPTVRKMNAEEREKLRKYKPKVAA
jgi:hypothetical protein